MKPMSSAGASKNKLSSHVQGFKLAERSSLHLLVHVDTSALDDVASYLRSASMKKPERFHTGASIT